MRLPIDVPAMRAQAKDWYRQVWTQRVDVARPVGGQTFDPNTGTYSSGSTTVATGMACSLSSTSVPATRDVAGDPATLTRLELKHDPAFRLQVDDAVTFTVHDDAELVGDTFHVIGVGEAYEHVYGLVFVQRTEPDSGG